MPRCMWIKTVLGSDGWFRTRLDFIPLHPVRLGVRDLGKMDENARVAKIAEKHKNGPD